MNDQCAAIDGSGIRCGLEDGHAGWHGPAPAAAPTGGWAPSGVSDGKMDRRQLAGALFVVVGFVAAMVYIAYT